MSDDRELDGALKVMYLYEANKKHEPLTLLPPHWSAILCELERLWNIESQVKYGKVLMSLLEEPTPADKWRESYREVAR
jgi:hypothetical protein